MVRATAIVASVAGCVLAARYTDVMRRASIAASVALFGLTLVVGMSAVLMAALGGIPDQRRRLTGTIVDAETKQPIRSTIEIAVPTGTPGYFHTSADGAFDIAISNQSFQRLKVTAPRYESRDVWDDRGTVELHPLKTIHGVAKRSGTPLSKVALDFRPTVPTRVPYSATTMSNGVFQAVVIGTAWTVQVAHDGHRDEATVAIPSGGGPVEIAFKESSCAGGNCAGKPCGCSSAPPPK